MMVYIPITVLLSCATRRELRAEGVQKSVKITRITRLRNNRFRNIG